jgi:hypothetical protein
MLIQGSRSHQQNFCVNAGFKDLEVRAAFMDDIMEQPDGPELDMMVDYDTRSLR